MESFDRLELSPEVVDFIKKLHPSERKDLAGVFSVLDNDYWRDTNKLYFGDIDGIGAWAIAEGGFTVGFMEQDDGTISISFLNKRSRFRPGWP